MPKSMIDKIRARMNKKIAIEESTVFWSKREFDTFLERTEKINGQEKKAIKIIERIPDKEQADILISNIKSIKKLLSKEDDIKLLEKRTIALINMLNTAVVESASPDEISKTVDAFLLTMLELSPKKIEELESYSVMVLIGLMIIGLIVLSNFVFPLIPIAAGLASLGLVGLALTTVTSILNFIISTGSALIISFALVAIKNQVFTPVVQFIQKNSDEYLAAETLSKNIHSYFSANQQIDLSTETSDEMDAGIILQQP